MTDRERLTISFSGGRSSAVMLHLIYAREIARRPVVVTFANTGAEHPATLDFVRDVETHWGIPIVWIEAEISATAGVGPRANVVTFDTASRLGEPFEAAVSRYGIPNTGFPHCTRVLKQQPMRAYFRDVAGWEPKTYSTAIGLRADEIDRVNLAALDSGDIVYPLIGAGYTKEMVGAYMRRQRFDLQLPGDHYGNCVTCWKKSDRKLFTLAQDNPASFDLFARLEALYPFAGAGSDRGVFFRKKRTAIDIVAAAQAGGFERYADTAQMTLWDAMLDVGGGCGESCEAFADSE